MTGDTPTRPTAQRDEPNNPLNTRPGSDLTDREFMDIVSGDCCHHGNGLTCRECQYEAEADDATWD